MGKLMIVCAVALVACGGSSAGSVNPVGTYAVSDALRAGSSAGCGSLAPETLSVVSTSGGFALDGYAMAVSYCADTYCELQGTKNGVSRDISISTDGKASGLSQQGDCVPSHNGVCCVYASNGAKK